MNNKDNTAIPGGSRLTLKPRGLEKAPPVERPPELSNREKRKLEKKRSKMKPAKGSRSFGMRFLGQSVGAFVIGMLVFGGFLYHQAVGMTLLTPAQAEVARGVAMAAFVVILIIEAFTEDMMQGILCLFLVPYSFIYGLLFADAGPIRGLTMAVIVFLGAEMYFTPKEALVPQVADTVNGWIFSGQDRLINPDRPDAGFER